jgi:hypothetical protein
VDGSAKESRQRLRWSALRQRGRKEGEWTILQKRINIGSEGEWTILRKRIDSGRGSSPSSRHRELFFRFFRREEPSQRRPFFSTHHSKTRFPHCQHPPPNDVLADHAQLKNCIPCIKGTGICLDVRASCILVCMPVRRRNCCLP